MSLLERVLGFGRKAAPDQSTKLERLRLTENPTRWGQLFGGGPTFSGKTVSVESTLQLSTAFACIRLLAQTVGTLPLIVYERDGNGGKRVVSSHPLYSVLHDSPNADQTAPEFWEVVVGCLASQGNSFSRKVETSGGRLVSLSPMEPGRTTVKRDELGARVFHYRPHGGGEAEILTEDEVFFIRGFSLGGETGLSPIAYARQTVGSALAAEESAGRFFGQGLQASGFVTAQAGVKMDKDQRGDLQKILDTFLGSEKAGKVMALPAGFDFTQLSMNPDDAQLLATRQFGVEEICRWFGVPPILVGHAGAGQTMWGSGVEQIMLGFYTMGLRPILTRVERSVSKWLISSAERSRLFAEFKLEGLLRADSAGRAAFYSILAQNGILTRNEIRGLENLPRVEGGDELTVQSNLVPLLALPSPKRIEAEKQRQRVLTWLGAEPKVTTHAE